MLWITFVFYSLYSSPWAPKDSSTTRMRLGGKIARAGQAVFDNLLQNLWRRGTSSQTATANGLRKDLTIVIRMKLSLTHLFRIAPRRWLSRSH